MSGDSPLIDPCIIDEAISIFDAGEFDLVTNVLERTFPPGQSVEVVRSEKFLGAQVRFDSELEREHVTQHFYKNRDNFRIRNILAHKRYADCKMAVDDGGDFKS